MELFWLKGYAATSLNDLADATGLNKKSLYNEFGSKEALFKAALDRYNASRFPRVTLLNRKPLGRQNIIDYLQGLATDSSRRGCLLSLSVHERTTLEDDASRQVREDFRALAQLFEMNLRAETGADEAAVQGQALLLGSQLFSVAGMGKLGFTKAQVRAAIDALIDGVVERH